MKKLEQCCPEPSISIPLSHVTTGFGAPLVTHGNLASPPSTTLNLFLLPIQLLAFLSCQRSKDIIVNGLGLIAKRIDGQEDTIGNREKKTGRKTIRVWEKKTGRKIGVMCKEDRKKKVEMPKGYRSTKRRKCGKRKKGGRK